MERHSLKLNTYKVSGDNSIMDEQNHITPEVRRILEEIHPEILKGSKDLIKKLDKLCLKYPRVPVFKNMLSSVYQQNDNIKQAYAVNRWLVKEHPDYLFGKLNLAAEFLLNGEPEKIPEILGETMEISETYPNRKEFHIEEVIGFNHISIQYFLAIDNIEQAEVRLKIMEDLDEDHPQSQYAREYLQEWYFYKASERLEDEDLFKKSVVVKNNRSQLQTTRMPEFHFPKEIGWLYQNDLNVDHEIIEEILKLDSSILREDLEKMLEDSIARFDHFSEKLENEGYDSREFSFPMHSLLLLSELKSEQSLPLILQMLQQDREFNELWFGEFINEVMENALYHCGTNQTQLLFDFLKLPNVYNMNKACVGEALVKIIEGSSEKREVFVEQYRRILNVYIENAADENYADTDAIGFIISDITDLAYKELLPEIKQLFDLDLVGFWICGIYEEVKTEIQGQPYNQNLEFINQDLFEKYYELSQFEEEELSDLNDEFSDLDLNQDEIN